MPPLFSSGQVAQTGQKKELHDEKGQYLVDFYGRDFWVTSDVLTPRPESEMLIDEVLTLAGKSYLPGVMAGEAALPEKPLIFDIGTGSGCLAITLKLELPEAEVVATDVSREALEIAKVNASALKAPTTFIIAHLLNFVKGKNARMPDELSLDGSCRPLLPRNICYPQIFRGSPSTAATRPEITISTPDLIVANLPYVDKTWDWLDFDALKSDPELALFAEEHGLALIYELIEQAEFLQIPRLVLEADPCQHQDIIAFALKHHYTLYNTRGFCLSLKYSSGEYR